MKFYLDGKAAAQCEDAAAVPAVGDLVRFFDRGGCGKVGFTVWDIEAGAMTAYVNCFTPLAEPRQ